ncbi:hypothetical protein B1992_08920 [Pseudoxanthomonas broegbernensis]|uniref:YetF C-terminal domain-containing protein n=1 Tax=Pseudoxanthomonas broegbernensis TaxID=83619 RepID=A0A7V8K6X1_9GAMM|nr:hypothetical protein B1992_08920 [Pseudoxanthomonas broegbernensis]
MDRLFSLSGPWWEFLLRGIVVYVAVLVLVRIVGKRTVGQYTPFDMIVVVLLGTAVQNSLIGEDVSLIGGLMIAATLLGLNWLVGFFGARYRAFDAFVEGRPVVLARDGTVFHDQLRRQSVSEEDLAIALRKADCHQAADIRLAMLETSGEITVLKCERPEAGAGRGLPEH